MDANNPNSLSFNGPPVVNTTSWMKDYQIISTVQTTEETLMQYGTTSMEQSPQQSFLHYDISETLWKVVPPFILLAGTFGNVMTVLVMRKLKTDRGSDQAGDPSMSVYFPSLAVCDQIVLTIGLTRQWVKSIFLFDIRTQHMLLCKLHKFLVFSIGRMATWILVAVTSQRVLTVVWPLRQRMTSTKKRAKVVVGVIVCSCLLLDTGILALYYPQTTRSGKTKCWSLKDSPQAAYYEDEVYPWLNIMTGSLLPLTILVVNNFILSFKVSQAAKVSRRLAATEQAGVRTKQNSSPSLTLIVTSITFVMLTSSIPVGFFVKRYYLPTLSSDGHLEADVELADAVLDLLWYCNSAVNFYLYFLTGPTFRQQARRLLCSGSNRRSHGQSSSATGTTGNDAASSVSNKDSVRY